MNHTFKLKPHEFMVKNTPHEAWVKGRGAFLWLAFFASEIGAGLYLVALFLNLQSGWVVGWLLTLLLGGGLHTLYLGKPQRGILMLLRPATSELSRGLWVILLFAGVGFWQVAPVLLPGLPWTGQSAVLKGLMGLLSVLVIIHGFQTMSMIRALPLWNSAMLIPIAALSGIAVGSQIARIMIPAMSPELATAELWCRYSLPSYILLWGVYLMAVRHTSASARFSIQQLLRGDGATLFYVGAIVCGVVLPLLITIWIWSTASTTTVSAVWLWIRLGGVLAGDLSMRYAIMKNAFYTPLI